VSNFFENNLNLTYKNSVSTLMEIERAIEALPPNQQKSLFEWLSEKMRQQHLKSASRHSVLDIAPVSVGAIIRPLVWDDDLLGEMLVSRRP